MVTVPGRQLACHLAVSLNWLDLLVDIRKDGDIYSPTPLEGVTLEKLCPSGKRRSWGVILQNRVIQWVASK